MNGHNNGLSFGDIFFLFAIVYSVSIYALLNEPSEEITMDEITITSSINANGGQ